MTFIGYKQTDKLNLYIDVEKDPMQHFLSILNKGNVIVISTMWEISQISNRNQQVNFMEKSQMMIINVEREKHEYLINSTVFCLASNA